MEVHLATTCLGTGEETRNVALYQRIEAPRGWICSHTTVDVHRCLRLRERNPSFLEPISSVKLFLKRLAPVNNVLSLSSSSSLVLSSFRCLSSIMFCIA